MSRLFISSLRLPTQFRLRTPNRITGCERQSSGGKAKEGLVTHAGLKRIHDSRSNVSRTGVPAFFLVAAISVFSAAGSQAESGPLRVTVKDVTTHYALHADVMLEGPQKVSVRMNGAGRAILTLVPGEYRIEASEPSHKTLRTHCRIAQGANLRFTILLEPENLPREEHPEILNANERPGFTLLHGYTVDADTGKPIAGVKVRVGHANVETWSDSVGHYLLSVPTPKSKFPEVWVPTRWSSRKEDIRQKNSPTSEGPELKWAEKRTS